MPTQKKRVNVSLSKPVAKAIGYLAKRDDVPYATKAAHLLEEALELEEDITWEYLAKQREAEGGAYIPQKDVWAKYGL
ncbi:toxin-antitoxin system, antitoxin component [Candidatus Uhrbacteria bacterium]|nr:toxin-antitoxin system, antitoxin component [Candidatus Uhrbacteria bacterium]